MADGGTQEGPADPGELEIETWEAPPAVRAFGSALLWCFGIGTAAGAAAGFAFLIQDDELRGASALLALIGAVVGAAFAAIPALYAAVVLGAAAKGSRAPRTYRRWVTATVATLVLLVPITGLWIYRSFSYDLRDDNRALAIAVGVAVAVAEAMLIPMRRSLQRIRADGPDAPRPASPIPNPFGA